MPRHPDTRQRIERAAVVLFASKGVDATTTKEIAAAVGISEGAIYRHFKSKDELVWHLFSTNYFDLARRIDAMLDETPSFADRIDGAIGLFCTLFDRDAELFAFFLISPHGQLRRLEDGRPNPVASRPGLSPAANSSAALRPPDAATIPP